MIAEFDRQVGTLLEKGYPEVAGLSESDFLACVEPLREHTRNLATNGSIPFVLVVSAPAARMIELVERRGKPGFTTMDDADLARFEPLELPHGLAYLITDVDTGGDTLNVTPDAALDRLAERRRSPLTIDEGIALVTHYAEAVARNAGFSLLGSRCGDRRVTALWISKGRPRLGWCWAGNPHTWLGSASCASRLYGLSGEPTRTRFPLGSTSANSRIL